VRTVVVSDVHLGTITGRDLMRHAGARAALAERLRDADHVVLLGDVLELREAPLATALGDSEPFFRELGEAAGGARVTLVPGNHDHRLAAPLVEARRLEAGGGGLSADSSAAVPAAGPLARIADWLGSADLQVAYPGVWIRPDVYATHGHYLDCHLAIPTLERLAIALTERVVGAPGTGDRTPDDYEAVVQPLYDLTYGLAQSSHRGRRLIGAGRSTAAWQRLAGSDGRRRLGARLASGLVVPGAVGMLNRAGLGPLTADLSGPSLRRSGLRAMAAVASSLGVDSAHVLFGHTHRSGPWPRDDPSEWELAGGGRLVNTGSWMYEPAFLGRSPSESPYWPGTVVVVEDDEPPRLERLLETLPAT
jgi:Calcineurin-like phosphoesterase superfamily domain